MENLQNFYGDKVYKYDLQVNTYVLSILVCTKYYMYACMYVGGLWATWLVFIVVYLSCVSRCGGRKALRFLC